MMLKVAVSLSDIGRRSVVPRLRCLAPSSWDALMWMTMYWVEVNDLWWPWWALEFSILYFSSSIYGVSSEN